MLLLINTVGNSMNVLNRHKHVIPEDAIYVGRPTKWGNPWKSGIDGTRKEVIDRYEDYVRNSKELYDSLPELFGKDLVCSCAPLPCHADVLVKLCKELMNDDLKDY